VGGVVQVGLEITDDRAEKAPGEEARPERAIGTLADRRQLTQGGSDSRGETAELPADFIGERVRPVRGGQSGRLGGIGGGTQGMSPHMGRGCGLPGGSGGGYRCRSSDLTSGGVNGRKPEGLSDAELATGEGP
jgi:hypothetical protein